MSTTQFGITLGDPGGVGPEIVLDTLSKLQSTGPITIYGPHKILLKDPFIQSLHAKIPPHIMSQLSWIDTNTSNQKIKKNTASRSNGLIAYDAITRAIQDALEKKISGILTAPISKTSLSMAGLPYTGHTTLLKEKSGSKEVSMAFYSSKLSTILATIHIPLMRVCDHLTLHRLQTTAKHAMIFCEKLGIASPKIGIAGLNPHAGENGLFGNEEQTILAPFLAWCQSQNYPISGPYPPDTLYHRSVMGDFDLVISLYHDQGLIPIKLLAFDEAVNVTIGLPFIRTSPDHGTAYDIAYQGKASNTSFHSALMLLQRLV